MSFKKNILALALLLFLFIIVAGAAMIISQELKNIAIPEKNKTATHSQAWGAYTGATLDSLNSFEHEVGKKPDISAVFLSWGDPFPRNLANSLKSNGQTLLVFWEPAGTTLDQIISGSTDSYISTFVAQAKSYGGQVILVPMEEMNGNWDTWDGTVGDNTPNKIITAFRRVHDLFSGASNVKWGWGINNQSVPDTKANAIANYYPGDNYVDYVGVDGFNFGNPWQSYSDIFSSALQKLKSYNKPVYIFSMSSAGGSRKAAWITDAISQIKSDPSIAGWVWFNENKEQDWLVNSDPASLLAFQTSIK